MLWEEYEKINDDLVGKKVFITDVRLSDGNSYIRNVPPMEVVITSNDDLPEGKTVYYSDYHFRKLNKKGEPLKQVIAPYDNTGYRSLSGVSVNVFDSYEEAVEKYNNQLDVIVENYEYKIKELNRLIEKTRTQKIK